MVLTSLSDVLARLECPSSLEPLTDPVSLIPCGCHVNKAVAIMFYGMANQEGEIKSKKQCFICHKGAVLGYTTTDCMIKDLVNDLLKATESKENAKEEPEKPAKERSRKKSKRSSKHSEQDNSPQRKRVQESRCCCY